MADVIWGIFLLAAGTVVISAVVVAFAVVACVVLDTITGNDPHE